MSVNAAVLFSNKNDRQKIHKTVQWHINSNYVFIEFLFIKKVIYLFTYFFNFIFIRVLTWSFFSSTFILFYGIELLKCSIHLLSVRWSVIIFIFIYTEQHYLEQQAFKTTIRHPSFSSLFFNVINTQIVLIVFKIHPKCSGDVLPVELWSSGLHKSRFYVLKYS